MEKAVLGTEFKFDKQVNLYKGKVRDVYNIDDKYLYCNHMERGAIKAGEFVRADDLSTVANLEIEFADSEIDDTYTTLNAGDKLVFNTDGIVEKVNAVTGYKVYFEVIALSGHRGGGVRAKICVN